MITFIYLRLVFGLMFGVFAGSSINAQNQISDEVLIALAKQKQDKIKAEDYSKFHENFLNSTKAGYHKYKVQWYEDNKDRLRRTHNAMYDGAQKNPKYAKEILGDPTISREAWIAKFDKEWNPKKWTDMEIQDEIAEFQRLKERIPELFPKVKFEEIIENHLRRYTEDDPRRALIRQQLKQWLDKY